MTQILAPRTLRPTWAALAADARARGVTGLRCDTCGHVHGLGMLGRGCNASHPTIDGATCEGWDLTEIKAVAL